MEKNLIKADEMMDYIQKRFANYCGRTKIGWKERLELIAFGVCPHKPIVFLEYT